MAAVKKEEGPVVDWKQVQTFGALPETARGLPTPFYASASLGGVLTYTSGNLVFVRNIKNPGVCDTFQNNDHKGRVTVAAVSPNGEWIASGDDKGVVLIWASRPGPHNVKLKVEVNKRIWDLCWSADSQRVIAVGEGQETKAKAFTYDSGNTTGAIDAHAGRILTVTHKPTRPWRVATGAEDLGVNFYEGTPYKWVSSFSKDLGGHDRFPNCVRYSPTGNFYISVGSDSKIFVYDGKDGKMVKKVESKDNHKSAILSVAWNAKGTEFVTAAMDKTVKVWEFKGEPEGKDGKVDASKVDAVVKQTFMIGGAKAGVPDMQTAVLYAGDELITVSTSGAINYLDAKKPETPKLVIQGHQHAPRGLSLDRKNGFAYTADDDGTLAQWDIKTGLATWFSGCTRPHDNNAKPILAVAVNADGSKVITAGADDKLRFNDVKTLVYNNNGAAIGGSPTGLVAARTEPNLAVVVTSNEKAVVIKDGTVLSTTALGFRPNTIAINHNDTEVAIGGNNGKLQLFALAKDGKLTAGKSLAGHVNRVLAATYNPDSSLLVTADSNRSIIIWKGGEQQNVTGWPFHNSAVYGLSFNSNGTQLVSCSQDQDLIIWSDFTKFDATFQRLQLAHPGGATFAHFLNDNTIISAGEDRAIRLWEFKPSAASAKK